ncbi:hypothetical protein [Algoriphagus sp.]|uniref:hypothetical protein n=1 Tax=Algoriphagus sp. TaxID=1872435 RepID=UPI00391AFE34
MNIREKENELFKRWREHSGADENTFFVQDGTLDHVAYSKAKIKICSVLKEVPFDQTAYKGHVFGEGFLKGLAENGPGAYQKKKGTLSILATRIALILNSLDKNQEHDPVDSLRESSYLNIKKYRGTKTSSQKDLEIVTNNDKEFLKEQIEQVLQPDVLLCGKTRHYLGLIYGGNIKFILEDESRKIKLFHLLVNGEPKRLIIEMYHPSHRSSEEEQLKKL